MSHASSAGPTRIYLIRHGEKPGSSGPPFGVDSDGSANPHSLLPRGWQRAGALVVLFTRSTGSTLATPTSLLSPDYGKPAKTHEHRTYQTVQPLAQRLGLTIATRFAEGDEAALADSILSGSAGTALVCWEHHHLPDIARAIPSTTAVPAEWPGDRFDLIWAFTRPDPDTSAYTFTAVPQQLLAGDLDA